MNRRRIFIRRILSVKLDELLEKVKETKDFLLNEFNEVEREDEKEIMEYIIALSYIENVIDYFNYKDGDKNEKIYFV